MAKYRVSEKQSLLDIVIQLSGSMLEAVNWANANDLSLTDDLLPGQEIELSTVGDADIANYMKARNIVPATARSAEDEIITEENEGIAYWEINVDFVVQ
ncbi:MAG: hypothetical protein ACK5L5_04180 [Bacteroidales bacterium]